MVQLGLQSHLFVCHPPLSVGISLRRGRLALLAPSTAPMLSGPLSGLLRSSCRATRSSGERLCGLDFALLGTCRQLVRCVLRDGHVSAHADSQHLLLGLLFQSERRASSYFDYAWVEYPDLPEHGYRVPPYPTPSKSAFWLAPRDAHRPRRSSPAMCTALRYLNVSTMDTGVLLRAISVSRLWTQAAASILALAETLVLVVELRYPATGGYESLRWRTAPGRILGR
ncbi:hypothetical protein OH77DRAFT_647966 [Trametes cingulata]|nr:hypothetical protein OH77DRAFT_647966 [Trametes cingulata]